MELGLITRRHARRLAPRPRRVQRARARVRRATTARLRPPAADRRQSRDDREPTHTHAPQIMLWLLLRTLHVYLDVFCEVLISNYGDGYRRQPAAGRL